MPNRIIREGWIESLAIDQLDAAEERFFLRLCLKADDFGRYTAHPQLLKSHLFPLTENVRSTDIPRWLAACETAGLVRCYEADAKPFLEIVKFGQRIKENTRSKFPEPPAKSSQTADKSGSVPDGPGQSRTGPPYSEAEAETNAESKSVYPSAEPPATEAEPTLPLVPAVTAESVYDAYPRKVARQDALKAIVKAMKVVDPDRLLERTKAFAEATTRWSDGDLQFIPHPATWFNRGSYDDDPTTWERSNPAAREYAPMR